MQWLDEVDSKIFLFLYHNFKNPFFNILFPSLSVIANRGALWITIAVASFLWGGLNEKTASIAALASVIVAGFFAEFTFKILWKRKRPFQRFTDVQPLISVRRFQKKPSFPSGHAAGYFAAATAFAQFFPQFQIPIYCVAILGAFSRVYCGVHFLSDVVAGSIIGILCGLWLCG